MSESQTTQRILWYLEDDPMTGRKGMYGMLQDMQKEQAAIRSEVRTNREELIKRIEKVEEEQRFAKFKAGILGGLTGFGSALGLAWAAVKLGLLKLAMLLY